MHQHFRDTFMMGCADFTTPEELFDTLSRRFLDAESDMGINSEQKVVTQFKYDVFILLMTQI